MGSPVLGAPLVFPGWCSSASAVLSFPGPSASPSQAAVPMPSLFARACFVLQLGCQLFRWRQGVFALPGTGVRGRALHTGALPGCAAGELFAAAPTSPGHAPRPPVWSSFAESLCPPPQGPYSGRCCSLSPPGYLLTASVAPQSATPCLCMPAGQPGGMVETGRIRRKEPPLCAERSRRLRHWAEAPRKETLSRGSC